MLRHPPGSSLFPYAPLSRSPAASTSARSLASNDEGLLRFAWRGSLFRVAGGVQPPKAGSLFFCKHLTVRPGERVLEIGGGLGLAAVLMAKAGAVVVATDIVPRAVDLIRGNALLNRVPVGARLRGRYAPLAGRPVDPVSTD